MSINSKYKPLLILILQMMYIISSTIAMHAITDRAIVAHLKASFEATLLSVVNLRAKKQTEKKITDAQFCTQYSSFCYAVQLKQVYCDICMYNVCKI